MRRKLGEQRLDQEEFLHEIGLRIYSERKTQNLSRFELGEKAALNEHTIRRIEGGLSSPEFYNITLIANALDISLDWVAFGEEEDDIENG